MALTDNLISYWKLEEASGTRVDSVVASANDLTDNNTVTQAAGKLGNAGQFTAANSEHLSRTDNASLSTGDIDFMWTAWVYLDTAVQAGIVSKGNADITGGDSYNLMYHPGLGSFDFMVGNGTAQGRITSSIGVASTGIWYFLVGWHNATADTVNIQVNDGTVDSVSYTGGSYDEARALRIGARENDAGSPVQFWDGRIDAVGFWKRVLTAAERTSLYNSGNGNEYPFGEAAVVVSPPILSYRHNQRTHRVPGTINPSWPI